ncbi:4-O-methyl-glucuronoyl methylesterase 1-like [Micropterus dolomieu]|uniref:4-O-methyl-glucuronoyl methylesterase 1-like n=1 Tax=Micropterus dolomieu TaxID=147949 RepID=UPI001E8D80D2|nr:4-O-methyl-glucuronoyl methylesterase 1-like [Micropterus dolomieu]
MPQSAKSDLKGSLTSVVSAGLATLPSPLRPPPRRPPGSSPCPASQPATTLLHQPPRSVPPVSPLFLGPQCPPAPQSQTPGFPGIRLPLTYTPSTPFFL